MLYRSARTNLDARRRTTARLAHSLRLSRTAFTLMELLIVVTLLGIAASLLIPSMTNVAQFHTEGAVRRIVSDIAFAQSDALARQARRRIFFNEDGTGYRLLAYPFDPTNDVLYDPIAGNGESLYIIDFAGDPQFEDVHLENIAIDVDQKVITFDEIGGPVAPDGTASAGGSFDVVGLDERFRVTIAAFTGRVNTTRLMEGEE